MSRIELVKAYFNMDDPGRHAYLSDDFQWTGELGDPIDKSTWVAQGGLVESAFPDLSLVIDEIRENGDNVAITSHFSGTFSNDLDLTPFGFDVIPATGKRVDFPSGSDVVSFENGTISELHNTDTGPDAGMAGFLRALGVKMG